MSPGHFFLFQPSTKWQQDVLETDFTSSTESIASSVMENEDNEINIIHDNREEKQGKKLDTVENGAQNSRREEKPSLENPGGRST